jgi:imidazolonepropionase
MKQADLLIVHAGELHCIGNSHDTQPRRRGGLSELQTITDGALAASDGRIVWVGATSEVSKEVRLTANGQEIDAREMVVTPGLVDAHTHPVFAAPRQLEFAMRVAGKSYQQIAAEGGGIANSVAKTRITPDDVLYGNAMRVADRMQDFGTTTAEAKSGYGLSLADELRMLRVIRRVNETHQIEWVPTALPAHEIPPEYKSRPDDYVELICQEILPAITRENLAEFNDVFFETGVFNREQTVRIQTHAGHLGFGLKFHVDELSDVGGAQLAAGMGAVSADHLVYVSDEGIGALASSDTVAVMLPGTAYFLDLPRKPPVRKMIETGVAIALATDCNPGSNMTESMQMAMNQACVLYKLSPAEAVVAATFNAACAIRRSGRIGAISEGRECDVVIWEARDYRELPYHYGVNLVQTVVKNGVVVRGKS